MTDRELERDLRAQRQALARARMRRIASDLRDGTDPLGAAQEPAPARLVPSEHWLPPVGDRAKRAEAQPKEAKRAARRPATLADRLLLAVEMLALLGVVVVIALSLGDLRRLGRGSGPSPTPSPLLVQAPTVAPVEPTATPAPLPTATIAPTERPAEELLPAARISPSATARPPSPTSIPLPTLQGTPDSPTGVRFVIPTIDVDAPMVEGDDWETLKTGIGHRIGSAWPGENGNVVASGHNDVYGAVFKNLRELQPGDLVYVYTSTAAYRYQVLFTRLVLPTEVSVMNPTRQPVLTLITCYPPFMDTHRIVVTAKLID